MSERVLARLAATARCSQRGPSHLKVRFASTQVAAEQRLHTSEDWDEFQTRRQMQKDLVEVFSQYGSSQTRENTFRPHHSLHRPIPASQATLSALLASGAHFGHSSSLMNPNFVPYAYGVRAGITLIDLDHTLLLLRRAANVVRAVAARNGMIVFVGTRPDLRTVVAKAAKRMGQNGFHVGERWLPGTLTNKLQIFGAETSLHMRVVPDLLIILNPLHNMNAIRECAIEHVPTIGIIDSNVDPRIVMYPIPANDENTRTAELVAGVLSIAAREGIALYEQQQEKELTIKMAKQRQRERTGYHHST